MAVVDVEMPVITADDVADTRTEDVALALEDISVENRAGKPINVAKILI